MSEVWIEDHLKDFPSPPIPDDLPEGQDGMFVELPPRDPGQLPAALRQMWAMVLLMAIRDYASSLHYHPWRPHGGLSYIVDDVRHEIMPPPDRYAGDLLAIGRSMFLGLDAENDVSTACDTMVLRFRSGWNLKWDVIWWSTGYRAGLELYPIDLTRPPQTPTEN